MYCPSCKSTNTKVADTCVPNTPSARRTRLKAVVQGAFDVFGAISGVIVRLRRCGDCNHKFFTIELNLTALSKTVVDHINPPPAIPQEDLDISALAESVCETQAAIEKAQSLIARECYDIAASKGWHKTTRSFAHAMCLVFTEIVEFSEASRFTPSEKIPEFSEEDEELADIAIRCMDLSIEFFNCDFGPKEQKPNTTTDAEFLKIAHFAVESMRRKQRRDAQKSIQHMVNLAYNQLSDRGALRAKMEYNKTRKHKHGKDF